MKKPKVKRKWRRQNRHGKRVETMNVWAIISRYYYNKNDDDKKQNEIDYRGGLCDMRNNRYAVYARRQDKKNWSDWCKVKTLDRA